jgi:hypothetical protein
MKQLLLVTLIGLLAAATWAADEPGRSEGAVFNVNDYGAKPDVQEDSGAAIRAAIEAAKGSGRGATVVLGKAKYFVGGGTGPYRSALPIENAKDLTVRGDGPDTLLIVTNPRVGCFFLKQCNNVTVRDVAIDYDPLPFTQGKIVAVDLDKGAFNYKLQKGYPTLDAQYFADAPEPYGKWGMIFDRAMRQLKPGAPEFIFMSHWVELGDGVWRMHPAESEAHKLESMEPGDRFVYMARGGAGAAVFFLFSKECSVENCTIYSSPGLATGAVGADATLFRNVRITYLPGSDRLLTTDADGVHCQQNLRGPIIENCMFEGMADDSVNIYYPPNIVAKVLSPTEVEVVQGGAIEQGDTLQVFDPREGIMRGVVEAAKVENLPGGARRITFGEPVEDVLPGTDSRNADTLYNVTRSGAGFVIRNNTFRWHRRHGMMLKASHGVVENNTIEHVGALAIVVGNDPHWPEGSVPSDITIRGNTIRGVGYSMYYGKDPRGAAIQVSAKAFNGGQAEQRLVRKININGNTIYNPPSAGIYAGACENVHIIDNAIHYQEDVSVARDTGAVVLDNVTDVVVDGLTVNAEKPEVKAALEIRANVPEGKAAVEVKDVTAQLVGDAPAVLDKRK